MTKTYRSLRNFWLGVLAAALFGGVAPSPPLCAQEVAATTEQIAKVLDLRTFPLPKGGKPNSPPRLGTLSYEWKGSPVDAMQFVKEELLSSGWTEIPSPPTSAQSVAGTYRKEGFTLTAMTSPSFNNRRLAFVALRNTGNIDVTKLPVPKEAKQVFSSPGTVTFTVIGGKDDVAKKCCESMSSGGWELFSQFGDQIAFRQNDMLLQLFFSETNEDTDEVSIVIQTVLMSFDISAPDGATSIFYDEGGTELSFITVKSSLEIGQFYTQSLSDAGWKPMTPAPVIGDSFSLEPTSSESMTFKNEAGDQIIIRIQPQNGKKITRVTHRTSKEVK